MVLRGNCFRKNYTLRRPHHLLAAEGTLNPMAEPMIPGDRHIHIPEGTLSPILYIIVTIDSQGMITYCWFDQEPMGSCTTNHQISASYKSDFFCK